MIIAIWVRIGWSVFWLKIGMTKALKKKTKPCRYSHSLMHIFKEIFIYYQKEENDRRVKDGLKPLPEEDVSKLFKDLPPVGRLESLLSSNRVRSN